MPYDVLTDNRMATLAAGDLGFVGIRLRPSAEQLPAGYLSDAENIRCRNGVIETRKGVVKLPWTNRITGSVVGGYGAGVPVYSIYGGIGGSSSSSSSSSSFVRTTYITGITAALTVANLYGTGVFRDPNSLEWVFFAADGGVYRTRPHNYSTAVSLPSGVKILSDVTFTQAFNKLYMFRGKSLAPLRLTNIDTGFVDIVALWASGTTYAANDEVAYGPFNAVTSITSVSDKATVTTTVAHGYISGADITISGASPAAFNGRYNIIVTGEDTFTYHFAGGTSPATGTITCSNMSEYWQANAANVGGGTPTAGQSPDTQPTKWTQLFTVIPNADNAIYVNNRLVIPTAYTPGNAVDASGTPTGYDSTSSYTKKDFVVATDYIDEIHFDFSNEFRINQGSADEIVDIAKFSDDTAVVFKGRSWGVLQNVSFDLSILSLDMRSQEYGMTSRGAYVVVGKNIFFMAERRGLVSIQQTEQNKLQGVDLPLSDRVQGWFDRINWNYQHKIRLADWDNKLFCAVPMDDARVTTAYKQPASSTTYSSLGLVQVTGLVIGARYKWTQGANESGILNSPSAALTASGEFTANFNYVYAIGTASATYTGAVQRIFEGVNNAVIVYDRLNQEWTCRDTGSAIVPKEWFKITYNGLVRLFFISEDGWVNLYEESDSGDQIASSSTTTGLDWEEITTKIKTRGYRFDIEEFKRVKELIFALATHNPSYSITRYNDGVSETNALLLTGTKDRTKYYRPFDKADYDVTNVNGDFLTKYRQDYSIPLGASGLTMTGLTLGLFQDSVQRVSVGRAAGRFVQYELTNTQGNIQIKSVTTKAVEVEGASEIAV